MPRFSDITANVGNTYVAGPEKWIVAKKPSLPKTSTTYSDGNTENDDKDIDNVTSDAFNDTDKILEDNNNNVNSCSVDTTSDASLNKPVVHIPTPPILLSQFTPHPPGTRHDYTAMDEKFNQMKKQAAASKQK